MAVTRVVSVGVAVAALVVALTGMARSGEPPLGPPALGYWSDTNLIIADVQGQTIGSYRSFDAFSLDGDVLVTEREGEPAADSKLVGFDISTHERTFTLRHAWNPVVAADGKRLVFLPTTTRSDTLSTVWMRGKDGSVRRIARFDDGSGRPAIPHDYPGDAVPSYLATDESARRVAVGLVFDSIQAFDVWLIDVKTGEVKRMTTGNHSRDPVLTPDGSRLAVRAERRQAGCGFRPGRIKVISTTTGATENVTGSSCDVTWGRPVWADDNTLVLNKLTFAGPSEFDYTAELISLDLTTMEREVLVGEDDPCCLTSSPDLGIVAFEYLHQPGAAVLDLDTDQRTELPLGGYWPHLSGEHFLNI